MPREAVGAPSLESLKSRLDGALVGGTAHGKGLELDGL